jgi:hypothetical protein
MNLPARIIVGSYALSLKLYPAEFRADFSEEMKFVFAKAIDEVSNDPSKMLIIFGREMWDWPGSIWQAHMETKKGGSRMDNEINPSTALTKKEITIAMTLYILPAIPAILTLIFGYQPAINRLMAGFYLTLMAFITIILIGGIIKGFPRWVMPFLGILVTAIVILEPSWRIWELFYQSVMQIIGYYTKTLQVRVLYSTLRVGFVWFCVFVGAVILVLLLAIWPRTRRLVKSIHQDWTLFSFMLYGGVVFALELVFEEYAYDELWKIACWGCLALGAWVYLKSSSTRNQILSLVIGVTLTYWIAAVGKWHLVPIQTWGAFHGHQYELYSWFEFWSTLGEWGWVILFMLAPALLTLMPRAQEAIISSADELISA